MTIDKATLDAAETVLAKHGMETTVLGILLYDAPNDFRQRTIRADRLAAPDDEGGGWWWRVSDEFGDAMTREGEWLREPLPSERTAEFFACCRFRDFGEALAVFVTHRDQLLGPGAR